MISSGLAFVLMRRVWKAALMSLCSRLHREIGRKTRFYCFEVPVALTNPTKRLKFHCCKPWDHPILNLSVVSPTLAFWCLPVDQLARFDNCTSFLGRDQLESSRSILERFYCLLQSMIASRRLVICNIRSDAVVRELQLHRFLGG